MVPEWKRKLRWVNKNKNDKMRIDENVRFLKIRTKTYFKVNQKQ